MNKPEALSKAQEKILNAWEGLQPRERILLIATTIIIITLVVFTLFRSMWNTIDAQIAETETYRKNLSYIVENQALYQANRAKKEAMRQRLLNADSKVVNKLTSMASTLGFDVTVTPKDAHKTADDSGTEEQEIEVTLKNVDYYKFIEYLVQIQKLDTPMFMRHINMNRTCALTNSETKMTVSITLMSYRLKE